MSLGLAYQDAAFDSITVVGTKQISIDAVKVVRESGPAKSFTPFCGDCHAVPRPDSFHRDACGGRGCK